MLAVPLKLSGPPPAWSAALTEHMARNFGGEAVAAEYARDVTKLVTTRARASAASGTDNESMKAVRAYLRLLKRVEAKFATLKGGEGRAEWKGLVFTWNDAFRPKKTLAQNDAEYERACVYFNLGALESLAGMQQDRHTVDGIKASLAHFQAAAGVFSELLDGLHQPDHAADFAVKGPLTSDLSPEGLTMLKSLMLAQAQVCYLEKATKDGLKASVLSKLAVEASKLYDSALTSAGTPTLQAVLDKAWPAYIEFHKREYEAWAEYYAAIGVHQKAEETGDGYGEEIARLRKTGIAARAAIDAASRLKLPGGVANAMVTLVKKAAHDEAKAVDDNNKIYMNPVPDAGALGLPPGAQLAKPAPPPFDAPADEELFKGLLPPWVRTAEALFQSKLTDMVKQYGDRVETRTSEIRVQLAEAGLPASVESTGAKDAGVPDLTWKRVVDNVHSAGGVPSLLGEAAENRACNERAELALFKIESSLAEEEQRDAGARAQGFSGQTSAQLNSTMRAELARYRHLLAEAKRSDDALSGKLSANAPALDLLGKSREGVAAWLPPDGAAEADRDPDVDRARTDLSMLLVNLGVKVQEIETAQTSLVEQSSSDSLAPRLEKADQVQTKMAEALAEYRALLSDIDAKLGTLGVLFTQVLEKNHAFAAMRHQNDASKRRETAIKQLDDAVARFGEMRRSVEDGSRFYEDVDLRIAQLKTLVDDFCYVRDMERDQFKQGLQRKPSIADTAPVTYASAGYSTPAALGASPAAAVSRAPAPVPQAVVLSPQELALPADRQAAVRSMRDFLGANETRGVDLIPYLERAKWDVNAAVNDFLENPQSAQPVPQAFQQMQPGKASPVPAAVGAPGRKSGWFR